MSDLFQRFRLDKTAFSVANLHDPPDDVAYWQTKTQAERLAAAELMRRINYGTERCTARLQRVLEVAQRERR